jgi:hypothetical protein
MLNEGRKENLIAKYGDEELIKDYLTNSDIHVKTNYKYADWYLKQYYSTGSDIERIEDGDDTIEKFEKYRKNLEKKDINQYKTYSELFDVIAKYEGDRPDKLEVGDDYDKIIDTEDVLVVVPKTHEASCKYGAGTKWCTTAKNPQAFSNYTSSGILFYIFLKKFTKDNPYYKMAIHYNIYNNNETWYDSKDDRLGRGEQKLSKMVLGDGIYETIIKYVNEKKNDNRSNEDKVNKTFEALKLDNVPYILDLEIKYKDLAVKQLKINIGDVEVYGSNIELNFRFKDEDNVHFTASVKIVHTNNGLHANLQVTDGLRYYPGDDGEDTELRDGRYKSNGDYVSFKKFKDMLQKYISERYFTPEKLKELTGKAFWSDTNRMSTYKFNRNGKLTQQMVKYLDDLGDNGLGSKKDFFLKTGKLTEKNGVFYNGGSPINIGGYFSTFFSSLKNAGIIQYVRDGKYYKFKKGENYEEFKKGNLVKL